jgi:hypothetical protein
MPLGPIARNASTRVQGLHEAIALVVATLIDAYAIWIFDRRWGGVDPRGVTP